MKAYHGQAWWWGMAVLIAVLFTGCFTTVGLQSDEPANVTVTYGTGLYWGWYGGHYGYYPWALWYPYYNVYPHRYYVAPRNFHVPSYYDKYPQHRQQPAVRDRRDFGTTRKQQPQLPKQQNRSRGNRR